MLNKPTAGLLYLSMTLLLGACAGNGRLNPMISYVKVQGLHQPVLANSLSAAKLQSGFVSLPSDRRIAYEPGSESLALTVQRQLDSKAAIIQQRQYASFSKPISVYVLNSRESAKRYCASESARGCVVNQRLFISNRGEATLSSLLLHELSHLHFEQKLGMYRYHSNLPAWFQEGLAVFVSDGAGAEKVPFAKAIDGLRSNKSIIPNASRSLKSPKRAAEFGMKNSMFYAQSGIFVKYLHQQSPEKFKRLILNVASGNQFSQSLYTIYGKPLGAIWSDFKSEIARMDLASLRRYNVH